VATRAVAWGTGTIAVRYQHTDSLGSPVAETDAAGMLVSRHSYAPYGEVLGSTPIDGTGYTGHVMDRDTGLTYMQQRYYDPIVGRFLSVDPVRTNENSGENFSRYTYVNSNPYTLVDPDGREFEYPKGTPADFINNVASAFNGLNKIGRADGVGYLHLSSARVKIVPTADRADATQNRFNPKTKTIYWADQAAFEVKDVESGKVGVISPKTTLGHEIEHAINYIDSPKGFSADAKTPDPDFGNMEERTVIQGWEHETSRAAGEPLRGDHKSGKSVPFKCVGDGCK
ncbi:RHS repeat-associated core domain-containing protein, partial [Arenimonas oryziterrae]